MDVQTAIPKTNAVIGSSTKIPSKALKQAITDDFNSSRHLGRSSWPQRDVIRFFKGQSIIYKHELLVETILPGIQQTNASHWTKDSDKVPGTERALAVLGRPEHMQKVAEQRVKRLTSKIQNALKEIDEGKEPYYTNLNGCIRLIGEEIMPVVDKYYPEPARSDLIFKSFAWISALGTLYQQEKKKHEAQKPVNAQ